MRPLFVVSVLILGSILACRPAVAEDTAESLARQLQVQLLANPALEMKFDLEGEGPMSVRADLKHKRIRIESASMLVISDGTTIWNLSKKSQHVTIDAVSQNSPFRDPASLFKFAENYTAKSTATVGYVYQVELNLTPKDRLKSLLKAAGDISELIINVRHQGTKLEIHRASVSGPKGPQQTTDLKITALKKVRASDFAFKVTGKMKVLDLRE